MKMNQLIPMLPVRNVGASIAFYEKLGFRIVQKEAQWHWAMLGFDECRLMLDQSINQHPHLPRTAVLYLYPGDIAEYHQRLRGLGMDVPALAESFYGMQEFRMQDPDGNHLWIGQRVTQ